MNHPENAIVLAVGPDGSAAGLAFAVAEAWSSNRPVHLVHVLEIPPGEAYVSSRDRCLEVATKVLDAAVVRAKELAAGVVPVTGEVVDNGWTVERLVAQGKDAAMLVLEHRHRSKLHRLVSGSFANRVVARAGVPVVSVPEDWTDTPQRTVVTAAVQDPHEAGALLRAAFAEAQQLHAELVVLHAWWLASGYDAAVVDQAMRDEWAARTRDELAPVMDELKARFPDVRVTLRVRHAPPVEAVLDAALESRLLVIGRRHHLLPLGSHLGPVARASLDRAGCPVLVTPEPAPKAPATPSTLVATAP